MEQERAVYRWGGLAGMLGGILFITTFVILIVLGSGMLGSPDFGKRFGGVALVLGIAGFVMAVLQISDPASMIGAGSYFAAIFFYLILGWKLFTLSRKS